jgi:hypothetical protein
MVGAKGNAVGAVVVIVAWLAAVALQFCLLPVLIAAVVVAGAGYALVGYVRQSWTVLTVTALTGPSQVADPPTSVRSAAAAATDTTPVPEPVYRPYVIVQAWRDAWTVLRLAGSRLWQDTTRTVRRLVEVLSENAVVVVFIWPSLLGLALGLLLVAVPLVASTATLVAFQTALVVAWTLAWLAVVATLGLVEQILLLIRRIVVACPHPGCYRRFGLPEYACPADQCAERHRRLVPNRYGAIRHACRCGARLPTLVLLGRYRLVAFCPHCRRQLPGRSGRVRVEHLPIVGGPDAGKSTYLCLSVAALRTQLTDDGGTSEYVNPQDEQAITAGLAELRRGGRLLKTVVHLPRAVMLDVQGKDTDGRILYLFDPAGEYYGSTELVDQQRYIDHAEVALLVVDPLAISGVWHGFTGADRREVEQAAPANVAEAIRENPGDVVDRLVAMLRSRSNGTKLRRLLVVVTKSDVLSRTSIGAASGGSDDVRDWLIRVGWGNWTRLLEASASDEVRYVASGLGLDDAAYAEPLAWLSGIRLAPTRRSRRWRRLRRQRHAPRRPWVSSSRPNRITRGYRAGRLVVLVLGGMCATVTTSAAAYAVLLKVFRVY